MIILETCFLGSKLIYTFVIYDTGIDLNGLPYDSIFIFTGSFLLMTGIYMAFFFFNFTNIQQYVNDGSLDLFITKPVSLQFITTLRNVDFGTMIPNMLGGIIVLVVGWRKSGIEVSLINITGYIGYLISGVMIVYSVMLAPQLLSFVFIKGNALREMADSVWDSNGFSSLFVLGRLSIWNIIWGIIAPILFLILVRLMWVFIIKRYSSASS